jgi:hypothetical protein
MLKSRLLCRDCSRLSLGLGTKTLLEHYQYHSNMHTAICLTRTLRIASGLSRHRARSFDTRLSHLRVLHSRCHQLCCLVYYLILTFVRFAEVRPCVASGKSSLEIRVSGSSLTNTSLASTTNTSNPIEAALTGDSSFALESTFVRYLPSSKWN